jgi:hypothetical protein
MMTAKNVPLFAEVRQARQSKYTIGPSMGMSLPLSVGMIGMPV